MRESCGVFGISSSPDAAHDIFYGLLALQHRGQESAGISTFSESVKTHVGMGLLSDVFNTEKLVSLKGHMGVGHVRYSTAGASIIQNAQPIEMESQRYKISIGFNGNVPNYRVLMEEIATESPLKTACDAEGLGVIFLKALDSTNDIFEASKFLLLKVPAAYSMVMLVLDKLTQQCSIVAIRDRYGLRPLCIGQKDGSYIIASESVALDAIGANLIGDVEPGSVEIIRGNERIKKKLVDEKKAHCMFEFVYFSRPDSIIEGKSVYDVRIKLGKNLAKAFQNNADVIVPVPDTSRPAAEGIAKEIGLPVAEGLMKNRYVGRTFIMPEQKSREEAVRTKLNPVKAVLRDKRIVLIDDSIVRGTTTKKLVKIAKDAGAKSVDVMITCPPITSPCFYGIDMKTHSELIAANNTVEEIRESMGADSLNYQTLEGLQDAIGIDGLCNACLTGVYPTEEAQKLADRMKEQTGLMKAKFLKAEAHSV